MAKILTHQQQLALKLIGQSELSKHFYFTGGTALSHFYLQHRKSEDLDFFSEKEIDVTQVTSFLKSMKAQQKFDWHIDPLQLAARFNQADQFLDDPIMSRDVPHQLVVNYFQQEADQFQKQIIE